MEKERSVLIRHYHGGISWGRKVRFGWALFTGQNEAGAFRDDGLTVSSLSKRENENLEKKIGRIFKDEGLYITIIEVDLNILEFSDVELNLLEGTHKPYNKPNNTILYINLKQKTKQKKHPNSMKKNIPLACEKRL